MDLTKKSLIGASCALLTLFSLTSKADSKSLYEFAAPVKEQEIEVIDTLDIATLINSSVCTAMGWNASGNGMVRFSVVGPGGSARVGGAIPALNAQAAALAYLSSDPTITAKASSCCQNAGYDGFIGFADFWYFTGGSPTFAPWNYVTGAMANKMMCRKNGKNSVL